MPKLFNIRYGFATNSSSTHSVVILKDGVKAHDRDADGEFGWNFFTAASEEAKMNYLSITLWEAFKDLDRYKDKEDKLSDDEVRHNVYEYMDGKSTMDNTWSDGNGYIDHQSIITLPVRNGKPDRKFFEHFKSFLMRDDVAVLGGNDNTEEKHDLIHESKTVSRSAYRWNDDESIGLKFLLEGRNPGSMKARFDDKGKFWTFFDTESGFKWRMAFDEEAKANKSDCPELVDVKITDYCDEGCAYCYQGSTKKGVHGDYGTIANVADALGKLEVFEVAIGGGEPTTHPAFIPIIEKFNLVNIKPSFSSRRPKWIIKNWDIIKDKIGAVGLSIDTGEQALDYMSMLRPLKGLKVMLQVVVGAVPQWEVQKIFDVAKTFNCGVLLLGWKTTGRGEKGPEHDYFKLNEFMEQYYIERGSGENKWKSWNGPSVSFDTVLAEKEQEWLNNNSDKRQYDIKEGAHSMYIDCVDEKMGQSSFTDVYQPLLMNKNGKLENTIKRYFATV